MTRPCRIFVMHGTKEQGQKIVDDYLSKWNDMMKASAKQEVLMPRSKVAEVSI